MAASRTGTRLQQPRPVVAAKMGDQLAQAKEAIRLCANVLVMAVMVAACWHSMGAWGRLYQHGREIPIRQRRDQRRHHHCASQVRAVTATVEERVLVHVPDRAEARWPGRLPPQV